MHNFNEELNMQRNSGVTGIFWEMTGILILVCSLYTSVAWAEGANSKLSPWLRDAISARQQAKRRAPANEGEQRLTTVFLQTTETLTDEILSQYNCHIYAQLGDIAIATLPLDQVAALAQQPSVMRIEANQTAHTTMDTTAIVTHTQPAYTATAQHPAFTGDGVVVGLMDVGFDLTHPNFYSDATLSSYRIKAFWDQLAPRNGDSRFPVGREFTGADELLAQGCAVDGRKQTHGTHTLGIAAGSGYDTNYRGIAFGSDLCLVNNAVSNDIDLIDKADIDLYTSATDALGFKYIFDYADSQGKPCVASFSEGYTPYFDQDDLLYSTFLDRLCTPGHIIVVSAGNDGAARCYFEKPAEAASAGAFLFSSKKDSPYRLKADGPMLLHLHAYRGSGAPYASLHLNAAHFATDKSYTDTLFVDSDTCAVSITAMPSAFTGAGETIYHLNIHTNRPLYELNIALAVEGTGTHIEAFGRPSYTFTDNSMAPEWNDATYGHNILGPAYFPSVICVGSTSHRLGFWNYQGQYRDYSSGRVKGMRTLHSSMGPTISGLVKPDVMAPGDNIISSYSSYYEESNPTASDIDSDVAHFELNGRTYAWNSNAGTSMACPVVAGVIALWLQAKPDLTRQQVLDIFSRTCRQPDATLDYPNNQYGYGEIDGYRGLLDILGIDGIDGISHHQPRHATICAHDGLLDIHFAQQPTTAVSISIVDMSGRCLYRQQLQPTGSHVTLSLPHIAAGIYAVQLTGDSHITGSQLIRL